MKFAPFQPQKFRRRVFGQLWMLALQFVLGMILNLVGEDATGILHTIYTVVLWLHILTAIGLVEGAIFIALKAPSKLSWWTVVAFLLTSASGAATMMTKQDIWSLFMSGGFIASAWLTGMQFVRADREIRSGSV